MRAHTSIHMSSVGAGCPLGTSLPPFMHPSHVCVGQIELPYNMAAGFQVDVSGQRNGSKGKLHPFDDLALKVVYRHFQHIHKKSMFGWEINTGAAVFGKIDCDTHV